MNRNNSNPDADRRTIEKACGLDFVERYEADPARLHSTRDIRALLAGATEMQTISASSVRLCTGWGALRNGTRSSSSCGSSA